MKTYTFILYFWVIVCGARLASAQDTFYIDGPECGDFSGSWACNYSGTPPIGIYTIDAEGVCTDYAYWTYDSDIPSVYLDPISPLHSSNLAEYAYVGGPYYEYNDDQEEYDNTHSIGVYMYWDGFAVTAIDEIDCFERTR